MERTIEGKYWKEEGVHGEDYVVQSRQERGRGRVGAKSTQAIRKPLPACGKLWDPWEHQEDSYIG